MYITYFNIAGGYRWYAPKQERTVYINFGRATLHVYVGAIGEFLFLDRHLFKKKRKTGKKDKSKTSLALYNCTSFSAW